MILPEDLERIEFLHNLEPTHLNRVAEMARLEECLEGDTLFREGGPSSCIYFVLSGKIRLEVEAAGGEPVEVATVGAGELLGWSPVLGRRAMTGTARAATRCRLAVLDASQVRALCKDDPRFGMAFLEQVALALAERLKDARGHLARARALSQTSPFLLTL